MKRKCKILKGGSTNVVRYKKCIKVELSSIYLKTKKQPLKRRKKKEDKPKSFFDWMIKKGEEFWIYGENPYLNSLC